MERIDRSFRNQEVVDSLGAGAVENVLSAQRALAAFRVGAKTVGHVEAHQFVPDERQEDGMRRYRFVRFFMSA